MSVDCEFSSKMLFEQKASIEDGKFVYSRVHAVSYVYPGALTPTTARARTTIVYTVDNLEAVVYGGTIEKWSDKGWIVIEEFFDTRPVFKDENDAQDYLLSLYKSFTLGLPIVYKGIPDDDDPKPEKKSSKDKNPKLRVLSFGKYLKNQGMDNNYDNYESKLKKDDKKKPKKDKGDDDDDDSPDFDWI